MSEALLFAIQQKDSLLNEQLKEINRLREIIRKKDEALEFYANSLYYKTKFNEESNSEELLYTELFDDMGELAQQALNIGDKE